jgi:hypothetical protein
MDTSFTYNAWINVTDYTDFNWIIEQDVVSNRWILFRTDITTWFLNLIRLDSVSNILTNITSSSAVWIWIWKMVTATFSNTIWSKIFIDWVQVASDSVLTNTNNSTTPINIWARENWTSNFMFWNLWLSKIYNRALTTSEIQQLYYKEKTNFIY